MCDESRCGMSTRLYPHITATVTGRELYTFLFFSLMMRLIKAQAEACLFYVCCFTVFLFFKRMCSFSFSFVTLLPHTFFLHCTIYIVLFRVCFEGTTFSFLSCYELSIMCLTTETNTNVVHLLRRCNHFIFTCF